MHIRIVVSATSSKPWIREYVSHIHQSDVEALIAVSFRIVSRRHGRPLLRPTTVYTLLPATLVSHWNPRPRTIPQQPAPAGSPFFKCLKTSAIVQPGIAVVIGICLCCKPTIRTTSDTGTATFLPVDSTSGLQQNSTSSSLHGFSIMRAWRASTGTNTSPISVHTQIGLSPPLHRAHRK